MSALFLMILFISFCGEGLQNSVLGSVWPIAYADLGVALSLVGYVNTAKAAGRIFGGLCNDRLVRKWGTYKISAFGLFLICSSLLGYVGSRSFWMLCICSIPMGFGESLFIVTLNAFAAVHLKAKHGNWLNMLWSLGNALGPYIMSFCLGMGMTWNKGYLVLAAITAAVLCLLLSSYPYWKKIPDAAAVPAGEKKKSKVKAHKLKYMPVMFTAFFCYTAIENVSSLWGSSYIMARKGMPEDIAVLGTTFLFLGMTVGRFFGGFLSDRLDDKKMIHLGQLLIVTGGLSLAFCSGETAVLLSVALLGMGCAPIHPCFIHYMPQVFGIENTGAAVGFLVGIGQIATLLFPMIFGWISDWGGMWLYPFLMAVFALVMMALLIYQKKSAEKQGYMNIS